GQVGAAPAFDVVELGQGGVDVAAAQLQFGAAYVDLFEQVLQLADLAGGGVVHADDLLDLVEAEPQPLAAQHQPEADPVAVVEDPPGAVACGVEQSLLFVEANGPARDAEPVGALRGGPRPLVAHAP